MSVGLFEVSSGFVIIFIIIIIFDFVIIINKN